MRSERWAYIRWVNADPLVEELYDLRADPLEERNLVGDQAHARTLAEMRSKWEKGRKDVE